MVLQRTEDLALDSPNAAHTIGTFLARAVIDDILAPVWYIVWFVLIPKNLQFLLFVYDKKRLFWSKMRRMRLQMKRWNVHQRCWMMENELVYVDVVCFCLLKPIIKRFVYLGTNWIYLGWWRRKICVAIEKSVVCCSRRLNLYFVAI